jgi:two-component system response regulator HupR/HoxA
MSDGPIAERPVRVATLGLADDVRTRIAKDLAAAGQTVELVESGAGALAALASVELVIVDPKSGSEPTVEVLKRLRGAAPGAGLVVLTRHADTDDLYQVVRIGGIERYWLLPWSPVHALELSLLVAERRLARERAEHEARLAAECAALAEENRRIRAHTGAGRPWDWFPQASHAMRSCIDAARALAGECGELCIVGEPGSGRATLARAIHGHGPRAGEPFVRLPAALLRRGTLDLTRGPGSPDGDLHGALRVASKWQAARGGTLFVADIEDLDDAAQAVLAGLATGEVPGGGSAPRLIASASAEPQALGSEGSLHPRLVERLAGRVLGVPALRERRDDLGDLGAQLLDEWAARSGRPAPVIAERALAALAVRPWDGNLPELRELLERAATLAGAGPLDALPER